MLSECQDGARRALDGECEWYQLCVAGQYSPRRCPSTAPMFNPRSGTCAANSALGVDGQCHLYRQCLLVETVSPFGKWREASCASGQHFDQEVQKCIAAEISTCGESKKK